MGVPVVLPSWTPERISTRSSSRRWVTWRDVPGFRRSRSGWMSASESAIPGGQPSTTQPIAGPWDSPKLVTVKRVPRVLPDIASSLAHLPRKPPRHDAERGHSREQYRPQRAAARLGLADDAF